MDSYQSIGKMPTETFPVIGLSNVNSNANGPFNFSLTESNSKTLKVHSENKDLSTPPTILLANQMCIR